MRDETRLNLREELKGRSVLAVGTSRRLGEVADAIIHPTEGRLLGLAVETPTGAERILDADQFLIRRDSVIVSDDDISCAFGAHIPPEGVFALREIAGASVVTDSGQLIGRVSGVFVPLRGAKVEYEVVPSRVHQLLGGGMRLSAAAPHSFSLQGSRLIVSAGNLARFSPDASEGGRIWHYPQSWRLAKSARYLLNKYSLPLWFIGSITLLSLMVWL